MVRTDENYDLLHRGKYVQFLVDIIKNSNNYKRDVENLSYIMAIDAPWGTGKTFLIKKLAEKLKQDDKTSVIEYNAWQHDYTKHPLESLAYEILKSDAVDKTQKDNIEKVFNAIKTLAYGVTKDLYSQFGNTIDAFKQVIDNGGGNDNEKNLCSAFIYEQDVLNLCRESLKKACDFRDKKVIVLIDELDRCKPLFAIELLEVVKHLFNIENIVFVFALDVKELSSSVRAVYGNDFDATGYLCKFFDYMTKIPQPDLKDFITFHLSKIHNLPNKHVPNLDAESGEQSFQVALIVFIVHLRFAFELSLRDIITIIINYNILFNTLLRDYGNIGAHYIYLYFLTLKYKQPIQYDTLFEITDAEVKREKLGNMKLSAFLSKYFYIEAALRDISKGTTLAANNWTFENNPYKLENNNKKIKVLRCDEASMEFTYAEKPSFGFAMQESIRAGVTLDGVLFDVDLRKWEQIKDLSFGQYLQQQLENYNFVEVEK